MRPFYNIKILQRKGSWIDSDFRVFRMMLTQVGTFRVKPLVRK